MIVSIDVEELWKESLKNTRGIYSPRILDDAVETAFWREFMKKKEHYIQDSWAKPIVRKLQKILKETGVESVLEIGPGWGNFTLGLLQGGFDVTCLDISWDVLRFLEQEFREGKGLKLNTICSKWESYQVGKQYDAVFGYNCYYRMLNLKECIMKMNRSARKLCVMGMGTGERKGYIYFVNMLF